mmetsp:Transcript_37191/g.81434  ORF Transcript_37191/g.81434 Transcript_37191/m.81434 type:complete len:1243 (-) Transcript_37191:215-3943(-)|eukprot:CAMPEP_0178479892 /NCGR_PEP_ID=MMETSP0696-20121128/5415_1 /TAXON_ID=265572 /ORGANISM="Extubocellulus spinifer, Strain CCMP396" /LENGTH=1242 /DNA_ID=CAMNT_0020107317 /DNA_START=61 /DNA_END=3789 /DNA_ORIENTATION=+
MMLFLVLSALSGIFFLGNANADETPIDHAKRQIDWIVSNDGFYSPKLEFRRLSPEDATSPSGLFTSRDVSKGEVLIVLPRKLFVSSDVDGTGEESEDTCDTVRNLIKQHKMGEESEYWPYVSYVMDDRHKGDLPCDWSDDGKDLLESIIPHELLPHLDATEISYEEECGVDEDDVGTLEQFAYLSVLRRSWDDIMLPVVDMINHRNGRWRNVDTNSAHEGKDIQLYALRDIAADEQLYLSYNECTDCCCYANTYVLPDIMKDYGFIEQYPQRWNFENSWLNFEVDEVYNDGDNASSADASRARELKVTWISKEKPNFEDKYILHGHLDRLNNMRPDVHAKADALVSEHERSVIIGFYNALVTALDLAIVSASNGDSDNDDAHSDVCAEDDTETCSVSSRKYDNLEERPYEMFYMDGICNFEEANEARDDDRYHEVAVYKSHYQTLSYYHSEDDDDTCLNLDGHQEVCTSVRPHYHELMVHYAAGFVDSVERVIVLGGGDNMVLHEVLKYDSLKLAVVLELDQTVARSAFEQFGAHPGWNDERVEWYFGDAAKSIPMLPRDYYGTFDLVLIDLQTDIIEMLGIMSTASTLAKPSGIIVRNEDFGFGTTEAFAKHTVDLYNDWIPMFCAQGLTMGSNNVDVLMRPWKSHENIKTLHFRPDEDKKFDFWHSYRRNDDICKDSEGANNDDGASSTEQEQTSSSSILMIVEVEDIVVDLNSSAAVEPIISSAVKEAGLTKLSIKVLGANSGNEEGGAYVLVYILQEGYVLARVWPERKFIALDLLLWTHFHKQDDAKANILKALGNNSDEEKDSSLSYRIVTGGKFGSMTWKEDADNVGPPPLKSKLCTVSTYEKEPRDNPITQDDTDNVLIEGISLIQSEDDAVAVICGNNKGPCRAQDVLAKAGASVTPVWTCPTLQDDANDFDLVRMYGCEMETLMRLREIASDADGNGKISGIVIDQDVPFAMGQILHKVFSSAGQRKELLSNEYVIIETSLIPDANESTSSSWRRALLDMFRTDFVQFSPAYCAEVFFHNNAEGSSLELGVFSTGDDAFFSHLVAAIENIEATTNLAPDVRYVKNGVNNYLAEFKPKERFSDSDYKEMNEDDSANAHKSKKAHYLMGGQSVLQFQSSTDDEEEDEDQVPISCARIKDALQRSLTVMNGAGMDDADIQEYEDAKMGKGCVVVALWSGGNAIMLWDGQTGVDLNVFTNSESIEVHDAFADNLMKYIPSLKLRLRDDQPRGVGAS